MTGLAVVGRDLRKVEYGVRGYEVTGEGEVPGCKAGEGTGSETDLLVVAGPRPEPNAADGYFSFAG